MSKDEEFVRSVWDNCSSNDQCYLNVFFNYKWNVSLNRDFFVFPQFDTEDEAWSAAAEFTVERLGDIQLLEQEIAWLKPHDEYDGTVHRIVAREQAALATLKHGMRDTSAAPHAQGREA